MPKNNWVYGLPEAERPKTLFDMVRMTAEHYGVDPALTYAVFNQESGGVHQTDQGVTTGPPNPTTVERARGIFQVLPSTARGYNLDPDDPLDNIETGVRYLKEGLDAHKGSARGALAYYYGGPDPKQHGPFTQHYVDTVYPQLLLQHQELERQRGRDTARGQATIDAQKGKPQPVIRGATASESMRDRFVEDWPRLSSVVGAVVGAHDPRTREGRANSAGTAGDIAGSYVGSRIGATSGAIGGTAVEPGGGTVAGGLAGAYSGRRLGGPVGAFVAGAGEQLLEETGLPDVVLRRWGYNPVAEPPDPNSNIATRTLRAGWNQAWPAAGGQVLHAAVPVVAKRVMQSSIARGAAETFEKASMRDMNTLADQLDTLRTEVRELAVARNQGSRALRQEGADRLQALRDELDARLGQVGVQGTQDVAAAHDAWAAERRAERAARDAAPQRLGEAKDVGARNVQSTRDAAEEELRLAKARADASMSQTSDLLTAAPPTGAFAEPAAGDATVAAFEHARKTVLDPAGKAVKAASSAVQTPVDYRPLKQQAREILDRLLRPRDAAKLAAATEEAAASGAAPGFLTRDPATGELVKPAAPAAAASVATPKTNDELEALLSQVDDAQAAEIAKHPAMGILREIIAGPDSGPHILGHQWKSDLGHALEQSGAYDRVSNSVASNVTKKVTGTLRTALKDEGYDAATAAYDKLVPFFYNIPQADLVAQIANRKLGPEAIVQGITAEQSTFTKQLVDGLRAHGGPAGRDAIERLQSAWWHRNVLQGGVEQLADNVAKLEQRPEFLAALYGDARGRDLVKNTKTVANALARKQAEWTASREAAEAAKLGKVRGAEWQRDVGIQDVKELNAQEIREATERVAKGQEGVGQAEVARKQALEAQRAANLTEQRAAEEAQRTDVETRRQGNERARLTNTQRLQDQRTAMRRRAQGTPEERAFGNSSLGRKIETPSDVIGNLLLHHVAPQLGWLKLLKGAKTDDIIRYAVHSPARTRALVAALVAAPLHEPVPQITSAILRTPTVRKAAGSVFVGTPPPKKKE